MSRQALNRPLQLDWICNTLRERRPELLAGATLTPVERKFVESEASASAKRREE